MTSRMDRYHSTSATDSQASSDTPTSSNEKNTKQKPKKEPNFSEKNHRPKRKKTWFSKVLFIILFLIVAVIGYGVFGYQRGMSQAKRDDSIPKVPEESFNGAVSADGSINILLLGSDSRGDDRGRSDTIMLAHLSKDNQAIQLISFMRDTYVNIPDHGYDKLNAAYALGGADLVRETLKTNFNINAKYYAIVNFQSFAKIVDTLCPNGVEIDAERDINLDGIDIKKGPQKMDGIHLLQYARFRKDEEGDFGRVRRQQQTMNAVFNQISSPSSILNIPKAMGNAMGYTTTNIPMSEYPTLAKRGLQTKQKGLEKLTIPVEGSWQNGYYDHAGSVLEIDEAANNQALQKFLN